MLKLWSIKEKRKHHQGLHLPLLLGKQLVHFGLYHVRWNFDLVIVLVWRLNIAYGDVNGYKIDRSWICDGYFYFLSN